MTKQTTLNHVTGIAIRGIYTPEYKIQDHVLNVISPLTEHNLTQSLNEAEQSYNKIDLVRQHPESFEADIARAQDEAEQAKTRWKNYCVRVYAELIGHFG